MWIYSTPTLFSMRGSPFLTLIRSHAALFSFSERNGGREGQNTSLQLPQRLNTPSSDLLLLEKNHIFYLIPNLHTFTLTGISSTRRVSHTRSFRDQIWFKIQSKNIHKNLLKQNWQENAFFFQSLNFILFNAILYLISIETLVTFIWNRTEIRNHGNQVGN